jgi:hypothetical protein
MGPNSLQESHQALKPLKIVEKSDQAFTTEKFAISNKKEPPRLLEEWADGFKKDDLKY